METNTPQPTEIKIFHRAASPADAETALRVAHRRLCFDIRPEYPAMEVPAAGMP